MSSYSRIALVGDIGGNHARFAISDVDELTIAHYASFRRDLFPSLQDAVRAYLNSVPQRPEMAGIAVASPLAGDRYVMSDGGWSFTHGEVLAATGAKKLRLLNNFEAVALSLPHLTGHDLEKVCGGAPAEDAAKVAVGLGTVLGVAGLVPSDAGWVAVRGEGGHVAFAATGAEDLEFARRMAADGTAHVSMQDMLSGAGLCRLHAILAGEGARPLSAPEIVRAANSGEDPVAAAALAHFARWLGRFAGDMALVYGARGGVYIGGGIPPHIVGSLKTEAFAASFRGKGALESYLAPVPVYVIKAAEAGLKGAAVAVAAANPLKGS
jgi:glucokinase